MWLFIVKLKIQTGFENLEIGFNLRILAGSLDTYSSIILDENSVEVYERT